MSQPPPQQQQRGQPSPQARHAPPARQLSDPSLAGAADGLASSPFHFNTSDTLSPHRSGLAASFAQQQHQQLSPAAAAVGAGAPLGGAYAGGRSPHDNHSPLRRSSISPAPAGQRQQQQSGGAALSPSQQAFGAAAHAHSPHSTNSSFESAPRSHSPAGGGGGAGAAHSPRSYTPSSLSAGYGASSAGPPSGPPPASPLGAFGSRGAAAAGGGGSNSDHSRHSSGYGSSLGMGGGGGGGTAASTTASYGAGSAMGASGLGSHSYTAQQKGFGSSSAPPPADDSVEAAIAAATKGGQPLTPAAISAAAAAIAASEQQNRRPSLHQSLSDQSQYSNGGTGGAAAAYGSEYADVLPVSGAGNSGPLSASDPRTQLFISNLPYRVRWQDLKDLFRKAGTVLRADVALTLDNRSRGHGTVLLASEEDAHRAVDMFRGFSWQGRILEVRIDRSGTILLPSPPTEGLPGAQSYMGAGTGASPNMAASGAAPAALAPSFKPSLAAVPPPGSGVLPSPSSLHLSGNSSPHDFASAQSSQQNLAHIAALHAQQAQQAQQQLYQQQQQQAQAQQQQQQQQQAQLQHQQQQPAHAPSLYAPQGGSNPYGSSTLHPTGVSPALYPFMGNANGRSASLSGASNSGPGAWPNSGGGGGGGGYGRSSFSGAANQAPGYHSQQHLHHTAHAPPPNLNAGAGRPSAYLGPPLPPGSTTLPPPNSYYGRVLFVGNLPFHCQWQDLKDLFRAAGNIQRADVALSPEGRSRGFGTVLFASAEDAQNAVRIYHGYEYSGRTLKVHFDRFAQMTAPPAGQLPGTPSQYTGAFSAANPPSAPVAQSQSLNPASQLAAQAARAPQLTQHHGGGGGYGGMHQAGLAQHRYPAQQQHAQQQQQYGGSYLAQQHSMQHVAPRSQASSLGGYGMPSARSSIGGGGGAGGYATNPGASGFTNPSSSAYGGASDAYSSFSAFGTSSTQPGALGGAATARPGHIALPPSSFPSMAGLGPLSPVGGAGGAAAAQGARGTGTVSVPMTPGMPGFTFHAIPQTPPTYPHHFLSPGLGPFSPPLGTDHPATPGAGSSAFNPLINPAPGAPLHNPLFPPVNSAAYAQQAQGQQQAQTQQQQQAQGSEAAQAQQGTQHASDGRLSANSANGTSGGGGPDSSSSAGKGGEGYPFPLVQPHLSSSLLQRRASTNSAVPQAAGEAEEGRSVDNAATASAEQADDLTETIARLSVRGAGALGKSGGGAIGNKASSGSLGETTRGRHPLSAQLLASDLSSLPQGSAVDDTTSSSSSGGGTPGSSAPPSALAPPSSFGSTVRRTSEQVPPGNGSKALAGHFGAHLSADAERRRSFAGGVQE